MLLGGVEATEGAETGTSGQGWSGVGTTEKDGVRAREAIPEDKVEGAGPEGRSAESSRRKFGADYGDVVILAVKAV